MYAHISQVLSNDPKRDGKFELSFSDNVIWPFGKKVREFVF